MLFLLIVCPGSDIKVHLTRADARYDRITVLENTHYKTARIVEGIKTEGVRSLAPVKSYLKVLRQYFGKQTIGEITTANLKAYRVMSEDEEQRLLAACELGDRIHTYTRRHYGKDREVSQTVNSDNPRLKTIILLTVDSGMRRGEMLKLRCQTSTLNKARSTSLAAIPRLNANGTLRYRLGQNSR